MTERLYIVRIVREAYVLSSDINEELWSLRYQIESWEKPEVTVKPWAGQHLDGWEDDDCCVYQIGSKQDTTLGAAKALDAQGEKA